MSLKIDSSDRASASGAARLEEAGAVAVPAAVRPHDGTDMLIPEQAGDRMKRSPALDSLLAMARLEGNSDSLALSLAEIVQSSRDTANLLARNKIDQLLNSKLAILQEKQKRLQLAQKKFEEAERLQVGSALLSKLRFGISALLAVGSVALLVSGVGSGLGAMLMLGAGAVMSTLSTVNEGLVLDNGKGIGGRLAHAAGANRDAAANWDMGVSLFIGLASAVLVAPVLGPVGGLLIASVDLANGGARYMASRATTKGLDLTSVGKRYEALIQELSTFLQQDTDNLIRSNDRTSDMLVSLLKTFSDVSGALTRVRFAS